MKIVVLDSGPLGRISNPRLTPINRECWQWSRTLAEAGCRVIVPEIADYEVRRELIRAGATTGIERLDVVKFSLEYLPLTTEAMLRAAELWAEVRRRGLPTASPYALDADAILAAQALVVAAEAGDLAVVATDNAGHLGWFVEARSWREIGP